MNEENEPINDQTGEEWEPPDPPEAEEKEKPQMSEVATLANIFFEPGNTFKDLGRKPRFLLAGLIIVLLVAAFTIITTERLGIENIARDRIESSSQADQLTKEQKDDAVAQQSSPLVKGITYGVVPIMLILSILLGGLIYWLGANAFGGSIGFLHGVSVWVYSGLAPTLLFVIGNLSILFLKPIEDIAPGAAQRGLLQVNPSMFIDGKEMPVLSAFLSAFDVFAIFGYILAAIGIKAIAKISTASAWAIVLIPALIGLTLRVVAALMFS